MKAKRLFRIITAFLPMVTIGSLCATSCSLFKTFKVQIDAPEGINLEFTNLKVEMGFNYWTYITSDKEIYDVNITVGDETLPKDAYVFSQTNESFKYYLKIYAKYITSTKLKIKIADKPIIENFTITFDAGEGVIEETGKTIMGLDFDEPIIWKEIESIPTAHLAYHDFNGWTLTKGSKDPIPENHIFSANETVYAIFTDCEHEFDIYGVNEQTNKMYVECSKCGLRHYLTDDELAEYEGKLLVKEESGAYRLSTYSVAQEISNPLSDKTSTIYLIYGLYEIGGSGDYQNPTNAYIHSFTDSQNGMTGTIECRGDWPVEIHGIKLNIYDCLMQGSTTASSFYHGLYSDSLYCENCYFLGMQSTYAPEAIFKDCVFDATTFVPYWSEDEQMWKIEYSLYLYNEHCEFEGCDFYAKGKAVKIYKDGPVNGTYIFEDVTFTWVDEEDETKPLDEDQFKACIEIDSTYQTDDSPYQILHHNLKQYEERTWGKTVDMFHDRSTHSVITEI